MKTKMIYFGMCCMIACSAGAEAPSNLKVKIGGEMDTQYGSISQKKMFRYENPTDTNTAKLKQDGLVNATTISFDVEAKSKCGTKYGGKVLLNADTYLDLDDGVADKGVIFVEMPGVGRIEAGSYDSATKTLGVSGSSIAVGAGGVNGFMPKWINKHTLDGQKVSDVYIKWPTLPIQSDSLAQSNKITYYTPEMRGVRFGVSYTPDSSMKGTVAALRSSKRSDDKEFNDMWNVGMRHQYKAKDLKIVTSATVEFGRAKKMNMQRKDLMAWEVGSEVEYKAFTIAGSYSNWGKSGAPKARLSGKKYGANYWTLGARYKAGNMGVSVTYFDSKRANLFIASELSSKSILSTGYNKNRYLSFGAEYKVSEGFLPYFELSRFRMKQFGVSQSNSGFVTLVGTRLAF